MAKFHVSHIDYFADAVIIPPANLPKELEVEIGDNDSIDTIADVLEERTGHIINGFYYEEVRIG